ncbi:MAG: hypothetical protein ACRCVE_07665, partial [Plesiomonas sp.]
SDITQLEKLDNYLTLMQLTDCQYIENYNLVYTRRSDNAIDVDFRYQDHSLFTMAVKEESIVYEKIRELFCYNGVLRKQELCEFSSKINVLINRFLLDEVSNRNNDTEYTSRCNNGEISHCLVNTDIEPLNEIYSILFDLDNKNKSKGNYQLKFYCCNDYSFTEHKIIPNVYRAKLLVNGDAVSGTVKQISSSVFNIIRNEFIQQRQIICGQGDTSVIVELTDRLDVGKFINNTKNKLIKSNLARVSPCAYYDMKSLYSAMSEFIDDSVNSLMENSSGVYHYFSDKKIKGYQYVNNKNVDIKTLTVLAKKLDEQVDLVKKHFYPALVNLFQCDEDEDCCIFASLIAGFKSDFEALHESIKPLQSDINNYREQYKKEDDFFLEKEKRCALPLKIKKIVESHQVLCVTLRETMRRLS